jgi:hypothetical protein
MLAKIDPQAVENLRRFSRDLVLERLLAESLARVTLDFDGSVLSTSRHAEGTAVGFNKKKKGARSYYPLFCTVAQSASPSSKDTSKTAGAGTASTRRSRTLSATGSRRAGSSAFAFW